MPNAPRSVFGLKPTFSSSTVEGLENVDTNNKSDGDILAYVASTGKWTATTNSATTAAITSLSGLPTSGGEIFYTTATNTFSTSSITAAARSFLAAGSAAEQRSSVGAEIGVDVQEHSGALDNVAQISSTADQIPYSTGSGYSNTPVSSYVRSSILNAADASAIATAIGGLSGSASTTSSVMRVTASNTLSESGVQIDGSDNLTGVNDANFGGDLTVTGTINVAGSNAFAQIANIGAETINATQWGYLGASDQGTATTDTPTFVGANMGSARVTAVAEPTSATDAATKSYVDTVAASGAAPLQRVQLATAASLGGSAFYTSTAQTLTSLGGPGLLSVDGVATVNGNRILVKDQSPNTMNGIYDVTDNGATPGPNWVLTRSSDFNQAAMPISAGAQVFVEINAGAGVNSGTTEALKATINNVDPLTDAVEFVQTSGTQTLAAGSGIDSTQLSGGTIQTDLSARLKYTGNTIDLNTIGVAYGGTGTTTLGSGNVLVGQGTSAVASTKAAPTGAFVGTTDTQTLTNKTATSSTNDITARALFSGSGAGAVSTYAATAPSNGQVLTATSGTTATWQTPASVSPASFEPDRTLFVFQSATDSRPDWSTIAGAIADASALTPTAADPVVIFVYPGTYSESTPLNVPAYVTISGMTSAQSSVIIRPTAPAPTSAVIRMSGNGRLYGLLIDGYDGTGAYATIGVESYIGTSFSLDYCNSITARNCTTGCFVVTGDGSNQYSKILSCRNTSALITAAFPFTCTAGYKVEQAGLLTGSDMTASGFLSSGAVMERGIHILNDYSYADIVNVQISSCTAGLVTGGGTTSNSLALYPHSRVSTIRLGLISANAIQIDAKAKVELAGLVLTDDTGIFPNQLDLYITNPASPAAPNFLEYIASNSNISKISLDNGASDNPSTIVGQIASIETNDNQFFNLGTMIVGYPLKGEEFVAGEGNSHSLTMVVKTSDGGVFSTVTENINSVTFVATNVNLATTAVIDLASAPATIDGVAPVSGVSRVLVKDGSTANAGTDSVDNGIYVWNGTGNAMTRASDFASGDVVFYEFAFRVSSGTIYTGARFNIDPSTFSGNTVTVATTSFGVSVSYANPFPLSPANDDAFYVGSTSLLFPGLKVICESGMEVSSGDAADTFIWEYWNGSAWTRMTVMNTDADPPFTHRADNAWGLGDTRVNNPGTVNYQVRFGEMDGWATTSVDSVTAYWVRCRLVDASNITQVPSIGRLKIHTNRTEINKNGFMEFFGNGRPHDVFSLNSRELIDPGNGSGFTRPGTQRLTPDSTGLMSFDVDQCVFGSGNDTAHGHIFRFPHSVDTSFPVYIMVEYTTSASSAGNVGLSLSVVATDAGDTIGTPAGTATAVMKDSGVVPVAVSGTAGTIERYSFEVDISDYFTDSQQVWMMFARNGSDASDTYAGNMLVYSWSVHYTKWSVGATGDDHDA